MKTKLLFLFIVFGIFTVAQKRGLELYKEGTNSIRFCEEDSNIRVKTFDGKWISGMFRIIDENTILVDQTEIALHQIEKIKYRTKGQEVLRIIGTVAGAILIIAGIIIVASTPASAFIGDAIRVFYGVFTIGPGAAFIVLPNVINKTRKSKDWKFRVITE